MADAHPTNQPTAPDAPGSPPLPDGAEGLPAKRDGWASVACLLLMVSLLWGVCFLMETARERARAYEANPDAPPPPLLPWQ